MSFQIGDSGQEFGYFQEFLNRKFASYSHIAIDFKYGLDEAKVIAEAMRRYGLAPSFLTINISGVPTKVEGAVATDEFLSRAGYRPPNRPIAFSVEGHMSDPNIGPAVAVAQQLESEGLCWSQPIAYNRTAMPFDNESGVQELVRLFRQGRTDNGRPFPVGTPWQLHIFSQGGIIGSQFMIRYVFPENGEFHNRLKDWRGTLAFGNPYRERDVIAEWVPDPPKAGSQGISDKRMVNTPTALWKEHSRHGDLYAENTVDKTGEDKTAVYKVVQNEWTGTGSIFSKLLEIGLNPTGELMGVMMAIISGVKFLTNMSPHGGYDLTPCFNWARDQIRR